MKKNIQIRLSLLLFWLISFSLITNGQAVNINFEVVKQCKYYAEFSNLSYSEPGFEIIGYLWVITNQTTGDTVAESTTENPILSFANSGMHEVTLNLLTIEATNKTIYSISKTVEILESPAVGIEQWDELVCSNADSSVYEIVVKPGFYYQWDITDIPERYVEVFTGINSNKLTLKWGQLEVSEGTQQYEVKCTITANENGGKCESTISRPIILLSSSVPVSTNIQIIPKSGDNSILFCIIDNPENYRFDWGYLDNDFEKIESAGSIENYYQYKDGIIATRKYFVDILNKDYTYCKTRVWFDPVKNGNEIFQQGTEPLFQVLNLYPNPSNDFVNIDLYNSSGIDQKIAVSIFNFMGKIISTHQFELSKQISKITIPTHILSSGTYYLDFKVSGNQSIVKKFVVINN